MKTPVWPAALGLLAACHVGSPAGPATCSATSCGPQQCGSDDAGCDGLVLENLWIWNGQACVQALDSGCSAVGPDCDALYPTEDACRSATVHCTACR
jgi:hypothetical protein